MHERPIVTAKFAGQDIEIRLDDGYFSLTALCRANGKRVNDYLRQQTTREYIAGVAHKTGIPVLYLLDARQRSGTFAHPDVALHCAQWCSWECAHWAIKMFRRFGFAGVMLEIAERGTPVPVLTPEVSGQLDLLARTQEQLERAQRQREHEQAQTRKEPSAEARQEAEEVLRTFYGNPVRCPCPRLPVHLVRNAEWDHYRGRADRRAESGWLIDGACHDLRPKESVAEWDDAFHRWQRYRREYRSRRAQHEQFDFPTSAQPEKGQLAMFESRVVCGHCRHYTPVDDPQCHTCGQKADA